MDKKNLSRAVAISAYSYLAILIVVVLSVIVNMSNVSQGGSPFGNFLVEMVPWISYLFIGAMAGAGLMLALIHKTPKAIFGGITMLVYVILRLVWIVKSHSIEVVDSTYFTDTYYLFMIMPIVLAVSFVVVASCYDSRGLRVRSLILLALSIILMISLLTFKNSDSVDTLSGSGTTILLVLLAYSIMQAVFLFKWRSAEKQLLENAEKNL